MTTDAKAYKRTIAKGEKGVAMKGNGKSAI
jgi:hypothetical protein